MKTGEEFAVFVHACLTGIVITASYECLRTVRHLFRHRAWMIDLEDIVYWIVVSLYVFVQIYHTISGVIRWFFALGVVVGVCIFRIFVYLIKKIYKKIYVLSHGKNRKNY